MAIVILTVKSTKSAGKDFEIPTDISACNIIRYLAETLGLPPNTAAVTYRIMAEPPGRYLRADETLEEAGVPEGAILNIVK